MKSSDAKALTFFPPLCPFRGSVYEFHSAPDNKRLILFKVLVTIDFHCTGWATKH